MASLDGFHFHTDPDRVEDPMAQPNMEAFFLDGDFQHSGNVDAFRNVEGELLSSVFRNLDSDRTLNSSALHLKLPREFTCGACKVPCGICRISVVQLSSRCPH